MKKFNSIFLGTRLEAYNVLSNYSTVTKTITVKNSRVWRFCVKNKLKFSVVNKLNKIDVFKTIYNSSSDLILSCGFPYILPKNIIQNSKKIINSHPSYLPKYKGYHSIKDAIAAGEKKVGVTLHHINEHLDSGEIIFQDKISIEGLNEKEIYEKVFSELEPMVINKGLKIIFNDG